MDHKEGRENNNIRAELQLEYFKLQDTIEDFDKRSLQIKGWIAAAAVAGGSLGLKSGATSSPDLWPLVMVVLFSVWCLEAYWKLFQYGFRDRVRILEAYFRDDKNQKEAPKPFQIYHAWYRAYARDLPIYAYENKFRPKPLILRFIVVMFFPFVFLPYLPLLVICLMLSGCISPSTALWGSFALAVIATGLYLIFGHRDSESTGPT